MGTPTLATQQIKDIYVRKNFEALQEYINAQRQLLDFKFFEQVFKEAATGVKIAHELPNIPLDVVVTHISGTGSVTFKYGQFDKTYVVLDVTGPCRIRFLVGTCPMRTTSTQIADADAQKFSSGVP